MIPPFIIKKYFPKIQKVFPQAFVNMSYEIIFERKHNIYFRLEDIESDYEFKEKVICWLSRPCIKGVPIKLQIDMRDLFCSLLEKEFTVNEIDIIYTKLGNGCNKDMRKEFMTNDFNIDILTNV